MEIITQNEAREWIGYDALPGGDTPRNPSINPVEKKEPEPQRREEPKAPDEAATTVREHVRAQVASLFEAEAKAVEKASHPDVEKNFIRWAERYYESYQRAAAHYLEMPCKLASALGIGSCDWMTACSDHARQSLNRLSAAAGICTKESLPTIGKQLGDAIRGQAARVAGIILGEVDG